MKSKITAASLIAALPLAAQDVISNAASGMNQAATQGWAPRLSAVAIVVAALSMAFVGSHAMKGVIAALCLAVLIALNANTIVGWFQAIS